MATHSLIGRDIGNYNVVRLLGEGGMGAVFEARHRFLGDRVALKVLHGTYAHNAQITQRFFQEAKAARDIGHPAVIKVIDFGQNEDGSLYLVMEMLDGESLGAVLERGPLPEASAARIAAALAEALATAHAKGVVHRDLKPDNIHIVGDGVKILDFGIAKVVSSSGNQTNTNALLGTPKYMAPEQARGAKFVGPHSDIWSLGVILFQMVTGKLPFEGSDIVEILYKIATEPAPRPSALATVSPELEEAILRCLEKDPKARPASMMGVRMMLVPWAGLPAETPFHAISSAQTIALPGRTIATTGSGTLADANGERASSSHPGTSAPRRKPIVAIAFGAAMLLGGVGTGVVLVTRPRPGATDTPGKPPVTAPVAPAPAVPPESKPAPPPPAVDVPRIGTFNLYSDPPGAEFFIDGKRIGITPNKYTGELGKVIEFKLEGYRDANAMPQEAGDVHVKLERKPVRAPKSSGKSEAGPKPGKTVDPDTAELWR